MKRVLIIVLSLLCISVCSCEKEHLNLLIGSWEMSTQKTAYDIDGYARTYKANKGYYSFEKNGQGKYFYGDNIIHSFTYKYSNSRNSITYESDEGNGEWIIDILTEETLIFHEEFSGDYPRTPDVKIKYVYSGKRI